MKSTRFPLPISRILDKTIESREPIARFIQLGNLSEVVLRYLATLTLGWLFLVRKKIDFPVPEKVMEGLGRPSFGHWCQLLHTLIPRLRTSGTSPIPEMGGVVDQIEKSPELIKGYGEIQYFLGKKRESVPRRFSLVDFFDLLAAFRNKTRAHGAVQSSLSVIMNPILESSINSILESLAFLEKYQLAVDPEAKETPGKQFSLIDPKCPAEGHLWVSDSSGRPLLSLFPAVIWRRSDFWFLNGWGSDNQIEYLCYETGFLQRLNIVDFSLIQESGRSRKTSRRKSFPRIEIYKGNIWDLPEDMAIMAQDRFRVFGPALDIVPPANFPGEVRKTLDELDSGKEDEETPGDVILSRRPWCASRYLLEVIAYDLDRSPVTDPATVQTCLMNSFALVQDYCPVSVALWAIGVEYKVISPEEFANILVQLLKTQHKNLESVARIIVVTNTDSDASLLADFLSRLLKEKVSFHSPGH